VKVLLVVHQFLPRHITGTEQYVRALALAMRAAGIDAHVLAYEPLIHIDSPGSLFLERDDEVEGIPVRRIAIDYRLSPNPELRDYQNPLVGRLLARCLDQGGFDLVHVFHPRHIGPATILEPRARGIPVVVNLMDFWWICPNYLLWRRDGSLCDGPPEGGAGCIPCIDPALDRAVQERGVLPLLRKMGTSPTPAGNLGESVVRQAHALLGRKEQLMALLAQADRVIAPSEFIARIYREHGLPAEHIVHLPYGLDPGRFASMPPRKEVRGKPHLDLGYTGSISRHKGVHVLIEAMKYVEAPNVRVHIHGRRDSQPGFSEALIDSIQDPRISFHGAFAPAELGTVLSGLDALVVPSLWYENTPFSVLEALHAGVPVIASDLGGIAEIVREGESGLLFAAGKAKKLAEIISRIAADPEAALAITPPRPPSIADNLAQLQSLYDSLIAEASAPN
jgi:glycosyltransferase involved in cell wall biosynthesis